MTTWTDFEATKYIHDFLILTSSQKKEVVDILNQKYPLSTYLEHAACQKKAINNSENSKTILAKAEQVFPRLITNAKPGTKTDFSGYAIVLTAGGDGERLRLSLLSQGILQEALADFTKATFQLPDFKEGYGSLQVNLAVIAHLSKEAGAQIPVIITTGPVGSVTHRVIPKILDKYDNFGLKHVKILPQDERLHLTLEGKIVVSIDNGSVRLITNPDETGGPFMKLKTPGFDEAKSALDWLLGFGCTKIIALQATALYDPSVISQMAEAGRQSDCLGVGVLRTVFDKKDQLGTFVALRENGVASLVIVEQGIRNDTTLLLKDSSNSSYLPYNTGLYVFDIRLLKENSLPDYATPPKEILASLPKSPKIGYAATDIFVLAKHPAVVAIDPNSYEVIKNADDLPKLALLAKRCGIVTLCK